MNRAEFLRRATGAIVAASAIDGASLEAILAEPAPQLVELTVNHADHLHVGMSVDMMLRDIYKPAVIREMNKQTVLLEML